MAARILATRNPFLETLLDRVAGELAQRRPELIPLLGALTMLIGVKAAEVVTAAALSCGAVS